MDTSLHLGSLLSFRLAIHASFSLRADALFELIDALLVSSAPDAPVELSQTSNFRRTFASVYEALRQGLLDREALRKLWHDCEPPEALTVSGYAVYALDSTITPRPDAETLEDRGQVYSAARHGTVPGHQFSWVGRILAQGQSWFAPRTLERIPTASTPAAVGASQVQQLAESARAGEGPKAVVADSGYAKRKFLQAFVGLTAVCVLVRLACNRVLYEAPPPKTGRPGAPKKHGAKFSLKAPRAPDRQEQITLGDAQVRVRAWANLHFKCRPSLVGLVVCVEFLRADGRPRYLRPLWLFWSGPASVPLRDLVVMYLLRFGIEHFFRFLKQQLGLLCAQTPELVAEENWVWLVALAYWQLLLGRDLVTPVARPWDPAARRTPSHLTPGQVKRAWAAFSHGLGTPAAAPRPSGKGTGRATGYQPEPRERHPVVKKAAKRVAATV